MYGNTSRFANHHCARYNLDAAEVMHGRRRVVAYRAKRDVRAGEELFVHYGMRYWLLENPCLCDAAEDPHLSGASYGTVQELLPGRREVTVGCAEKDEEEESRATRAKGRPKGRLRPMAKPEKLTQRARVNKRRACTEQVKVLDCIYVVA